MGYFSKFRAIQRDNPPKRHANLKFSECENPKKNKKVSKISLIYTYMYSIYYTYNIYYMYMSI